jgi:hypothetical protein
VISEKYIANRQDAKVAEKKDLNGKQEILAVLAPWRFNMTQDFLSNATGAAR